MENQNSTSKSDNVCPVCGGINWSLSEEIIDGYGAADYAEPCSKCVRQRRERDITGIPDMFYDSDLSKFDFETYSVNVDKLKDIAYKFLETYTEWAKHGKGLYFWSETPGSGKTFLMCCIARSVMFKYNIQMRFITAPKYITTVRDSYKRQQGAEDESKIFRECELLVLDDLGAQTTTEWNEMDIFNLINERLNSGKITLITSNMQAENLNLSDRTIDRIIKSELVIHMPEESIRRKESKKEMKDFLKMMFPYEKKQS